MASTRRRTGRKPGRELSLTPEQALQLAVEHHGLDRLDEAELIYAALLERWPDHPDVLNHMGVLQHQRGDRPRALTLLRRAAEMAPAAAGVWNNLGNVLLESGATGEAEQAFRQSLELADNPQAQANLSRLLRRRKAFDESEAACRRAIELAPDLSDGWHNLSLLHFATGRSADGVDAAARAMALLPPHRRRRDTYARALVQAGELEKAAAMFREWLAEEPDNAYVQHHLAACSGEAVPARASDAYVTQVFDDFASTFDAKLAKLRYRAPEAVTEALRRFLPAPARQLAIADLGCGTGLCGPLLAGWAERLAGCDLSAEMLELARQRGVYDELEKVELVHYLDAHPGQFDAVVSADTLIYFGALGDVAAAVRRALRPGGYLVFTVEALADGDAADHRLLGHGRYAHRLGYLEATLAAAGLQRLAIAAEVLRQEASRPVHGWVVTARLAPAGLGPEQRAAPMP